MPSVITLLKVIRAGLSVKDPAIPELVSDYEEYHGAAPTSTLNTTRAKLISELITPNSTLLDVGCGEGTQLEFASKMKGAKGYGIDISHKAIETIQSKGFEGAVRDIDREGLKLAKNQRYDYILFSEVLEHLKYPHKVLLEACEHAEKGVIVTTPNSGYIYWRLQLLKGYFPRQSYTHLHFWTINDFRIFLKTLNLQPLELKTDLPTHGVKGAISQRLKNLLSYQQCWLIAPKQPKTS